MTISRSSRSTRTAVAVLLAVVAIPLLGARVSAQDTTKAKPAPADTSKAAKPDTASSLLQQAATGDTHVVAKGETLWSIARLYFNDPLLWPEIYRLNTATVEDPHWIYPGQVLQVNGNADTTTTVVAQTDTAKVVAQTPTPVDTVHADTVKADTAHAVVDTTPKLDTTAVAAPAAADTTGPPPPEPVSNNNGETIFDHPVTPKQQIENQLRAYLHQVYRPVRPGEFYSAGWLTEGEKLPWGDVVGATARPAITRLTQLTEAGQYQEIAITPPGNASYHVGDSLLLARRDRDVSGWGDVIVPVGIARVTTVQPKQVLGTIIQQYGRIHTGNLALPLEPFRNPGESRPAPVTQGLQGSIVAQRDLEPLAGTQTIYFIDKGRSEGVTPGDIFEAYRPATGDMGTASEQVLVQFLIVHTREHSASALVIGITQPNIRAGTKVRLVRKMPS
ncbi:MAG TPA: LysM peptidoglycan-binding domain-containing protein [Gemmatimonadales bacterium]|nr:LysM peptidoglycan-binding domain-containing protein [Gemmatimonadales bacterium]